MGEEERLALLSKVVKSGSVETFSWEYQDRKSAKSAQTVTKKVTDI